MRFNDWPQRFEAAINAARSKTFEYGSFDCVLFCADVVQAITGIDHVADYRGGTKKDAARLIAEHGSLEGLVSSRLGTPVHPSRAHIGDVVIADIPLGPGESGEAVGICNGVRTFFATQSGLVPHPTLKARLAWRIV